MLGLLVATVAAATRFAAIGILPPSIHTKPFAHTTASTQVVVGLPTALRDRRFDPFGKMAIRAASLSDMVLSPEVAGYVARAAGLPASKIGILGPLWTGLWRSQVWASGPKRASQIVVENHPYQITLGTEAYSPPWPAVIDVATQAPSTAAAARLASAVVVGLNAYLLHLQAATGVPAGHRYGVTQLLPVSVSPPGKSQLLSVGLFTFVAVLVLWCGMVVAVSSLMRDIRTAASMGKVGKGLDRSSYGGNAPAWGPTNATT